MCYSDSVSVIWFLCEASHNQDSHVTLEDKGQHALQMLALLATLQLLFTLAGDAINPGCECVVFSSTYGKDFGTFHSPDYPRPYPDNVDCLLYSFIGRPHEIVHLSFTDFDVQKLHLDCLRGDHVKVFVNLAKADVNEWSPATGLLCGGLADVPRNLYSTGPGLVLALHSDGKPGNHSGFLGKFRFLDRRVFKTDGRLVPGTACDQVFLSDRFLHHGRFYSSRYPSSYLTNTTCGYRFRGRPRERVRVVFEVVSLQKGDGSCLERLDTLTVFDGPSPESPVIALLCDETTQLEVLSTGSDLYVQLQAHSRWPGQGFQARFHFQNDSTDADILPADMESHYEAVAANCDVTFSSDLHKNGTVTSPGYPDPYPPNSLCRFDFQGRGKERIQIVFSDFHLYHQQELSRDCDGVDSVVAYVHMDGRMEKIDSFCGSGVPKPLMSNGPRLLLEFRGPFSSSHARGFKASFSFTENFGVHGGSGRQLSEYPCAFAFNSTDTQGGPLTSPNFPGLYPRNTECHYFFHGSGHQRVRLRFHYFDVEGVMPCEPITASDYVEFSNFMGRDRKYSRYCGQMKEFDIESDRKFFRVTFRSNDRLDGTGFNATYEFIDEEQTSAPKPTPALASGVTVNSGMPVLFLLVVYAFW